MKYFMEFYVGEIRDEIINDIVKFMDDSDVLRYTNFMLRDNESIVNGNTICASYPRDIVRDNMIGYIKLYLLSTKSVCISKRSYYKKILRTKLMNFFGDNPMFGRECIKSSPVYLSGSSFEKTGRYTNSVKYYTDIIPNTFYHPQTFDGHRVIGDVIVNKHNVDSIVSFGGSNKRRRVITDFHSIPNIPDLSPFSNSIDIDNPAVWVETERVVSPLRGTLNQDESLPRRHPTITITTAATDDSDSDDSDDSDDTVSRNLLDDFTSTDDVAVDEDPPDLLRADEEINENGAAAAIRHMLGGDIVEDD